MKTKMKIALLFFICTVSICFTQEKSKKQLKEELKLEIQKEIEKLVNSKEFKFSVNTVYPIGSRSINVTADDYYVEFYPELIKSYLPFFGRGYGSNAYGGDGGIIFESKPQKYDITKEKKSYIVKAEVKTERDTYNFMLSIGFEGSGTLSINSNNRSGISYSGEIAAILPKEKN